jgi:hypothetical protein
VEFTKFKEAAMKKKFAVAMAITAGLCFAGSWQMKPAFAGYWEVLPNSEGDYAEPSDPNYSAWQSENALRAQGTSSYLYTSGNHVYSYYFDWKDDDSSLAQSGFYSGILAAYPDPGETGNAEGTGKRCIGFQWVPNQINGQDDPNDKPSSTLNIRVYLAARAFQQADYLGDNISNVNAHIKLTH